MGLLAIKLVSAGLGFKLGLSCSEVLNMFKKTLRDRLWTPCPVATGDHQEYIWVPAHGTAVGPQLGPRREPPQGAALGAESRQRRGHRAPAVFKGRESWLVLDGPAGFHWDQWVGAPGRQTSILRLKRHLVSARGAAQRGRGTSPCGGRSTGWAVAVGVGFGRGLFVAEPSRGARARRALGQRGLAGLRQRAAAWRRL